jgi:DNA polymerase I
MKLIHDWQERIEKVESKLTTPKFNYGLRKSPFYYGDQTNFTDSVEEAENMLALALQRPLSHIGFDTEFGYDSPGVLIDKNNTTHDPHSIRPMLLSLSFAEPSEDGHGHLYTFVVDLRKPELLPVLKRVFRLPVCFIGHFAKVELFCLWKLGIPEPSILWDTFIFEKALQMGRNHHKYKLKKVSDDFDQIQAKAEAKQKQTFGLSLIATCQRYGVAHQMAGNKDRLQQSFLIHKNEEPFSKEQIEYSAEDAIVAGQLYPLQIQKAVQSGLLHHCQTVEMAWVITNARIEWNGVRVDAGKRDDAIARIDAQSEKLKKNLSVEYGIEKIQSHKQLTDFFRSCGLLKKFQKGKEVSFDKKTMKENADLHPAIPLLKAARRASDLLADKILSPDFVGEDGRVHAEHRQLGTDTGRQTSRWPNLLGLDRVLRPLVVPEQGYGIGEVDWSQVEVGVAAAVYGDDELVRMFNSGDVYSAMAQNFYKEDLSAEDSILDGKEFKRKHKHLRNQMKTGTLGMIYGITPVGLSRNLGTTKAKAAAFQERFMAMFPSLTDRLVLAAQEGAIRGYAHTISGFKRYRGKKGSASHWERNWLTNHPVQGSAAVVFKAAGNRLDRIYQQYDARIIIPVHDAFIFEAPLDNLEAVSEVTSRLMCDTLQEYFPVLQPRVEVNISNPACWNKDGDGDELNRWIESLDHPIKVQ